ncbi:hypothetical protein DFP72DRAFT_874935 [Ephemerocybe angulata]|uniref:Uncharacterized protein n=1 Tax=Ephemerocybe angulata TaxID=980116 RepID=A0A8H6IF19_9AGAR|nr:hypothetical protein DFP72DRAFT_874935 [Tulosesus angulatus]
MHATLEPWKTLSKAFLGRIVKSDMVMSTHLLSAMYFTNSLSIPSVVPFLESARLPPNPGVSRKVINSPSVSGTLYSTISEVSSSSVYSPGVPLTASQTALINCRIVVLPLSAFPITLRTTGKFAYTIVGPFISFDIVQHRVDSQWRRSPILVTSWSQDCAG